MYDVEKDTEDHPLIKYITPICKGPSPRSKKALNKHIDRIDQPRPPPSAQSAQSAPPESRDSQCPCTSVQKQIAPHTSSHQAPWAVSHQFFRGKESGAVRSGGLKAPPIQSSDPQSVTSQCPSWKKGYHLGPRRPAVTQLTPSLARSACSSPACSAEHDIEAVEASLDLIEKRTNTPAMSHIETFHLNVIQKPATPLCTSSFVCS